MTTPEQIRRGLQVVTAAGVAQLRNVVTQTQPAKQRESLFVVTPLVVETFTVGSAALAVDWYEELREEADPPTPFTPHLVTPLREDYLNNAVAWATQDLADAVTESTADLDRLTEELLGRLEPVVQREIASGFWDTMTENIAEDPEADGWKRKARPGACPFCRMLADKGAVYRHEETATFAAHTNCHCIAIPVFGDDEGPEANVMQYVASKKRRTPAQRAALREYLKANYGA